MTVNSDKANFPLVSVIVPTFNRAAYLAAALNSALGQTYPNCEIIVIDDGSTDNTKEVVQPYLSKVQYVYQDNKGNAAARNTGLTRAKGKYIAFLDSDDVWLKEKCAKQVAFLEEHPDHAFVYSGTYLIDENGQEVGNRLLQEGEEPSFENLFTKNRIISLSVVMVRKEHLDSVGWLDENLRQSPDYDLYLRLSKKYPYRCLNELLCQYRVHESNISGNLDGRLKAHLRIFSKPQIMSDLGFFYGIRRRAKAFYQVAVLYYEEGQYGKAFKRFAQCILRDPVLGFTYYDRRFRYVPWPGVYNIFKIYYLAILSLIKYLSSK